MTEKRARSINFSKQEKFLVISLAAKYKDILENKKTDHVTNQEKDQIWTKITEEFNAISPESTCRSKECLKRLYDNKKKELRKKAADERKEINKTGGGIRTPIEKDQCDDVLLSIMNKKTIYGINSNFGGDVDSDEDTLAHVDSESNEIVYDFTQNEVNLDSASTSNSLCNGNKEVSGGSTDEGRGLTGSSNKIEGSTWQNKKAIYLQTISPILKKQALNTDDTVKNDTQMSHATPRGTTLSSARRRPCVTVKALTSSDVAAKYNMLLDIRLEIAEFQKNKLAMESRQSEIEHKKRITLLDVQTQVEKEKLKRLLEEN